MCDGSSLPLQMLPELTTAVDAMPSVIFCILFISKPRTPFCLQCHYSGMARLPPVSSVVGVVSATVIVTTAVIDY